jgi:hypothetical protein
MIVAKTKKPDGKGYVRKYQAGGPKTPYQRVLDSGILSEEEAKALTERYRNLNGIQLYQQVVRRLKRILRRQEAWRDKKRDAQRVFLEARLADSALRAAPSGTSASPVLKDGAIDLCPNRLSIRQRKMQSVQYLTNKKNNRQLSGAHPT